jgi:hypothetical protein
MTKTLHALTEAATDQTVYVNPDAIRFVLPAGHRTTIFFSERHALTVTSDLQSLIEGGLFEIK